MKLLNKKILYYAFAYIFFMIIFIWLSMELFDFSDIVKNPRENEVTRYYSFFQILFYNSKNFIGYVFLFPVFPVLILMDFFSTGISIVLSINAQGLAKTLLLLAPHGGFEIPNFILYTYLSGSLFYHFYKDKEVSFKEYFHRMIQNKKYYLFCFGVVIFAATMEGFITPAIYHFVN